MPGVLVWQALREESDFSVPLCVLLCPALKISAPGRHTKLSAAFAEVKRIVCQLLNHRSSEADWRSVVECGCSLLGPQASRLPRYVCALRA